MGALTLRSPSLQKILGKYGPDALNPGLFLSDNDHIMCSR